MRVACGAPPCTFSSVSPGQSNSTGSGPTRAGPSYGAASRNSAGATSGGGTGGGAAGAGVGRGSARSGRHESLSRARPGGRHGGVWPLRRTPSRRSVRQLVQPQPLVVSRRVGRVAPARVTPRLHQDRGAMPATSPRNHTFVRIPL